ncbi:MAG: hypothetical protein R3B45_15160 [Bdellovibrionota bacterium]
MKQKLFKSVAIASSFFLYSSNAFCLFDIQVFGGLGQSRLNLSGTSGSELSQDSLDSQNYKFKRQSLGITLHINPFQSLPVAFGLGYEQDTPIPNSNISRKNIDSVESGALSLELMSWYPLGGFALYVKGGRIVQGNYKIKLNAQYAEETNQARIQKFAKTSNFAAIGLGIATAPGIGLIAELRGNWASNLTLNQDADDEQTFEMSTHGKEKSLSLVGGVEMGI